MVSWGKAELRNSFLFEFLCHLYARVICSLGEFLAQQGFAKKGESLGSPKPLKFHIQPEVSVGRARIIQDGIKTPSLVSER